MALTYNGEALRGIPANNGCRMGTLKLGTYATGGVAVAASDLGLSVIDDIEIRPTAGYLFEFDKANAKVKAYTPVRAFTATFDPASLASVTARDETVTVTGVKSGDIVVSFRGPDALESKYVVKGARVSADDTIVMRADNQSAASIDPASGTWTFLVAKANGAGIEVANGTDLSGVAARIRAFGE